MKLLPVEKLRDCQAFRDDGLSISCVSNEAVKYFDAALHQYIGWYEAEEYGGLAGTCEKMMESDSDFVMGKIMSVCMDLIATGTSLKTNPSLSQQIDCLVHCSNSKYITEMENLHIRALKLFATGYWSDAAELYEEILIDYPKEILATKLLHDTYFYLGRQSQIRDSILRILPHYTKKDPFYGYLQGMLSFGFEETNMYERAEKVANLALQFNKHDAWATHTIAHIYESDGRFEDGIKLLRKCETDWNVCNMLACHLYWHWGVYLIEKGEYDAVLEMYDKQIGKHVHSGVMLDFVDSASLLYRLGLEGVKVGDRWKNLSEIAENHSNDQIMFFNDMHFGMSFLGNDRKDLFENLLGNIRNTLETTPNGNKKTSYQETKKLSLDICDSFVAFDENNYEKVVELLYPQKEKFVNIGGSNAQRDLLCQLLIHSCVKSNRPKHNRLAQNLINERNGLKSKSPWTDRIMANLISKHRAQEINGFY